MAKCQLADQYTLAEPLPQLRSLLIEMKESPAMQNMLQECAADSRVSAWRASGNVFISFDEAFWHHAKQTARLIYLLVQCVCSGGAQVHARPGHGAED